MRRKNRGFTLIELLAVIVILGLLMAIAIPSVTKYITQSRKKTVTTTVGNYIGALVNEVNDLQYTFTSYNTVYAVPIECISLERGGTDPFGEWYQANDSYWAYVLIQYDDENSKYIYGFTFKDSAGYGMYPTAQSNIRESGSQIKTGYDLSRPTNGTVENITSLANWDTKGFEIDASTKLVVLEAETEGVSGDGKETCTLCQKGDNYAQVEQEKLTRPQLLSKLIKKHNTLITATPTLTTTSKNSDDASGLYSSTDTNSGEPTYYFRGNVTNNNVNFAGQTWRIIRINEDGTVRLILNSIIDESKYFFNTASNSYTYVYYSNESIAKNVVESWYKINIIDEGYDSYIEKGMFCEQAKVSYNEPKIGNAIVTPCKDYIANFKCSTDGNGKGILNLKVGLITYDEALYAGGYPYASNNEYYLKGSEMWTMSPQGTYSAEYCVWRVSNSLSNNYVYHRNSIYLTTGFRPVINLNANALATGTGTSSDPYVIQTN